MSHIVEIQSKLQDPVAIAAACTRLNLPSPVQGVATLFGGEATGLLVRLPEWQYPVVIDVANGNVRYDNFGGSWGEIRHLDQLLQMYAVEKTKIEAHKRGFQVSEQPLHDGSIKLQVVEAA